MVTMTKKNKKSDRNKMAKKMARLRQANRLLESNIQDFMMLEFELQQAKKRIHREDQKLRPLRQKLRETELKLKNVESKYYLYA